MIDLKAMIRDSGLSYREIADRSGLSYSLVSKIGAGQRDNVRLSTYLELQAALKQRKRKV